MLIWNSENTNTSLPVSKSKDGFFSAAGAAGESCGSCEDRTVILKSTGNHREPRKHGEHHLEHQRADLREEISPEHLS